MYLCTKRWGCVVQMVRRLGAEFRRADESYVSALSLMAPVFELPLSDVMITDGEKAVLECRVAATPAAEVRPPTQPPSNHSQQGEEEEEDFA